MATGQRTSSRRKASAVNRHAAMMRQPAGSARPVLAGVGAEIAVGDVREFPEREDDRRYRGGEVAVLRRVECQVDGSESIGRGLRGQERQAALGPVNQAPGAVLLEQRGERFEHEVIGIGGRAEMVADAAAQPVVLTRNANGRAGRVVSSEEPAMRLRIHAGSLMFVEPGHRRPRLDSTGPGLGRRT